MSDGSPSPRTPCAMAPSPLARLIVVRARASVSAGKAIFSLIRSPMLICGRAFHLRSGRTRAAESRATDSRPKTDRAAGASRAAPDRPATSPLGLAPATASSIHMGTLPAGPFVCLRTEPSGQRGVALGCTPEGERPSYQRSRPLARWRCPISRRSRPLPRCPISRRPRRPASARGTATTQWRRPPARGAR